MTLQRILVYRQPARTRVVRNFEIGGTSRPEGTGVGVGGVKFWACHINGGVKYPLPGRGKFFIGLNCLKIADPPPPPPLGKKKRTVPKFSLKLLLFVYSQKTV